MKIHSVFIAACALLLAGGTNSHAATEIIGDRPVLWSIHFDGNRLRSPVGKELFTTLGPVLDALPKNPQNPASGLETAAFYGFQAQASAHEELPFLGSLGFSAEDGGITPRFDAIVAKRNLTVESIAGHPAIHFTHEGREIWIAKFSDTQLYLGTSRELVELAMGPGSAGLAGSSLPPRPDELLGGNVEVRPLFANDPKLRKSELFKLLSGIEFHLDAAKEGVNLTASADLNSERDAKRAARMIEGMVAALSLNDTKTGVPWDERFDLQRTGAHMAAQLHLDVQEAKGLFDTIAQEINAHAKSSVEEK